MYVVLALLSLLAFSINTVYAQKQYDISSISITVYPDNVVRVNYVLDVDPKFATIEVPLVSDNISNVSIIDHKGQPLDFTINDNRIRIDTLGTFRVNLGYDAIGLVSSNGNIYSFSASLEREAEIILPINAQIINVKPVPTEISSGNIVTLPGGQASILFSLSLEIPNVKEFAVNWEDHDFNVSVLSNSLVYDLEFKQEMKSIGFKVRGIDGTTGFVNATIPKRMLDGDFTVTVDNKPSEFIITSDDKNNYIYVEYTHSERQIAVTGTNVIPEFPVSILALVFSLALLTGLFRSKRLLHR